MPQGTADPIVAKVSEELGAILLTDDADFKTIAARRPKGQRRRFKSLSRVQMGGKPSLAISRLKAAMTLIEFEYEVAKKNRDKRMIVQVKPTLIQTLR